LSDQRKQKRQNRLRNVLFETEFLEARTLLATIPSPVVVNRVDVSNPSVFTDDETDESTPSIAVNPSNPNQVVTSWTVFATDPDPDFIGIGLRMSNNGGASWFNLETPDRRLDPSTSNPVVPFSRITDTSVAFAPDGSFYLLSAQHNDAKSAGAIILARYGNNGGLANETTVYSWNRSAQDQAGAKAVQLPILAIDTTASSFDTANGGNVTNPHVGNIYVTWIGQTPAPSGATNWNELTVELVTSTDGGGTFGNALVLNGGGNFGDQRNTTPRIAVSQGGGGSQPGQVTVVWNDFNSGATADPPFNVIRARQVFGGGATLGTETNVAFPTRVLGNATGGGSIGGAPPPVALRLLRVGRRRAGLGHPGQPQQHLLRGHPVYPWHLRDGAVHQLGSQWGHVAGVRQNERRESRCCPDPEISLRGPGVPRYVPATHRPYLGCQPQRPRLRPGHQPRRVCLVEFPQRQPRKHRRGQH